MYYNTIFRLSQQLINKRRAIINIFVHSIYLYDDHFTLIINASKRPSSIENMPLDDIEAAFDDENINDCDGCQCCDDDDDIGDIVDPVIGFNLENVIDSEFDAEEFNKGIKSMSFVAGQLMALQNAGVKPQNALEYLHATHSQDSDCECPKRVAELQAAVNEKAEKKNLIESKKNIA